jgi:hypothetical protein
MEIMFARVKDELARYRTAAGRTPFPNLDEEQRLKSKLQEAANNQIEMAQNFISLCTRIMQAAGISNSGHVDQTIALEALQRIENRLQTNELELSELRLQVFPTVIPNCCQHCLLNRLITLIYLEISTIVKNLISFSVTKMAIFAF